MLPKHKVYYLAGRMTGIPQFNIPRFNYVTDRLVMDLGVAVINPAELDDKDVRAASMASEDGLLTDGKIADSTWGDLLSRDLKIVADEVDGVIAMDDWWNSKGARVEVFVAISCHKPVYHYYSDRRDPIWMSDSTCMRLIQEGMSVPSKVSATGVMKEVA